MVWTCCCDAAAALRVGIPVLGVWLVMALTGGRLFAVCLSQSCVFVCILCCGVIPSCGHCVCMCVPLFEEEKTRYHPLSLLCDVLKTWFSFFFSLRF